MLHAGLNLADMAHVLALLDHRVIPVVAARRLLGLLVEVSRWPAERFPYDPRYGDAYNSRERFFAERLDTDAGWLHAGRPRREAGRIALRVCLRRMTLGLMCDAAGFAAAVASLAEATADTLMPDQTYLQQAQPSTFGHYVLAFAYPALRDAGRLRAGFDWVNQSPAGAGCVNGSRLALSRERTARLLGFEGVIDHTRDAMWQTDGFIDLLATRASLLMPQKRNPYALSIVRGAAGVLLGRLSGFLGVVKTPSARSDNLIFAYGEVPRSLELAGKVTRLMTGVVSTLRVNPERMWEALCSGFSQATDLAEYVMQTREIDYRSAYLLVGEAVRKASREGLRGVDITGEMLDEAAVGTIGRSLGLTGRDLSQVLDPRAIGPARSPPGRAAQAGAPPDTSSKERIARHPAKVIEIRTAALVASRFS